MTSKLKPVKLKVKSVCGDGKQGSSDSRQLALGAKLNGPEALCYDHATDRLFIGEGSGTCVRVVTRDGRVRVLAGTPGQKGYADGALGVARFGWINALCYDARTKTLFAADTVNHRLVSIDTLTGVTTTVAGAAAPGRSGCADGQGKTHALFCAPSGLALDTDNNRVFVADSSNHRLRAYDIGTGYVTTVSGRLGKGYMDAAAIGDAQWANPSALCFDARSSKLFVTDTLNRRIRVVCFADNTTKTLAGTGTEGIEDGKSLTVARFMVPLSIAYDREAQRVFIGDKQLVRVLHLKEKEQQVTTFAGLRIPGQPGAPGKDVDGNLQKAQFGAVHGLVWDHSNSRLFVADAHHHKVRVVVASKHAVYLPPCVRAKAFPQIALSDQKLWDKKLEEWALKEAPDRESQLSGSSVLKVLRIETKAKLQAKDVGGSSDPYFVLFLNEYPVASRRTAVTETHLYPVLDFTRDTHTTKVSQPCSLPLTNEALVKLRQGTLVLHVECWDKDPIYDDYMGAGSVLLRYGGSKTSVAPEPAASPGAVAAATAPAAAAAAPAAAAVAALAAAAAGAAAAGAGAGDAPMSFPWEVAPRDPNVHLEEDIAIVDGSIDGGRIRITLQVIIDDTARFPNIPQKPLRAELKSKPQPRESAMFIRALSGFGHTRAPDDDVVVPASPARSSISGAGGAAAGGARPSGVVKPPVGIASVAEDDDDAPPPPPPADADSPKLGAATAPASAPAAAGTPAAAAAKFDAGAAATADNKAFADAATAALTSVAAADSKAGAASAASASSPATDVKSKPPTLTAPSSGSKSGANTPKAGTSPQASPRGGTRSFLDSNSDAYQQSSSKAQRRSSNAGVEYDANASIKCAEPAEKREKKRSIVADDKLWKSKMAEIKSNLGPGAVGYDDSWDGVALLQVKRIDTLQPLLAKDIGNTSDPYFVMWLGSVKLGAIKTFVINKTLTPSFDLSKEPLSFPLTRKAQKELKEGKLVLHIECWDKDPVYDDFMGWSNVLLKRTPPAAGAAAAAADKASEYDVLDVMLFEKENTAGAVRIVLHHNYNWV